MSAGRRNRAQEPAEIRRQELHSAGRCTRCGKPSRTRRCAECERKIEAATARYHGQARPGPPTAAAVDAVDLRMMLEACTRARDGFAEVARAGGMPRRRRLAALAPALDQLDFALRLGRGVRRRNQGVETDSPAATTPSPRHRQLAFWFARGKAEEA